MQHPEAFHRSMQTADACWHTSWRAGRWWHLIARQFQPNAVRWACDPTWNVVFSDVWEIPARTPRPRLLNARQIGADGDWPECFYHRRFRRMFGHSVMVTPERCVEHAALFPWKGAAEDLLSPYGLLLYQRATVAANSEYDLLEMQERFKCCIGPQVNKRIACTHPEYAGVMKAARLALNRAEARAFGELYCGGW